MRDSDEEGGWPSEDMEPVAPKATVPKEKWAAHARKKLARGYVLIVSPTQRNANFFKAGSGYEMCSYQTAKELIQAGLVIEAGKHYLGTVYKLSAEHAPPLPEA